MCRNGYYRADADPIDMPCTSKLGSGQTGERLHVTGKGDVHQSKCRGMLNKGICLGGILRRPGAQSSSSGGALQVRVFLTLGQCQEDRNLGFFALF